MICPLTKQECEHAQPDVTFGILLCRYQPVAWPDEREYETYPLIEQMKTCPKEAE
jgi:hypothetical protein